MQALLLHAETFQVVSVVVHQNLVGGHMEKLKMILKVLTALYVAKHLKTELML